VTCLRLRRARRSIETCVDDDGDERRVAQPYSDDTRVQLTRSTSPTKPATSIRRDALFHAPSPDKGVRGSWQWRVQGNLGHRRDPIRICPARASPRPTTFALCGVYPSYSTHDVFSLCVSPAPTQIISHRPQGLGHRRWAIPTQLQPDHDDPDRLFSPPSDQTTPARNRAPDQLRGTPLAPKHIIHQSAPSAPAKTVFQRPSFRFRPSSVSDSPRGTPVI
jgi:hypothetical protein